jgi:hypothetical protein
MYVVGVVEIFFLLVVADGCCDVDDVDVDDQIDG